WFADTHVSVTDYPRLASTGLLVMFGNVNAAVPFLLDMFRIPADTFRLFVTSGVVNARFGTLVAAVHTLTVAVLGTCAVSGALTFNARKLVRFGIVTGLLTVGVVGGTSALLRLVLKQPYEKDALLTNMPLLLDRGAGKVFKSADQVPLVPPVTTSVLARVRDRRMLRVGYFEDSLPYVFFNSRGELVGLDTEMALQLARDLQVTAEFVPVSRSILENALYASLCDLVMSGVATTP